MPARRKKRGRTTYVANPVQAVARIVNGRSPSRRRRRSVSHRRHRRNGLALAARRVPVASNPRRARRSVKHYRRRNNPSFAGAGDILRQLGYGGLGAFLVSTATQLVPFTLSSPLMIFLLQLGLSIGVGFIGKKVFGNQGGQLMRIGAFAFTAGNAVQNFLPSLQQSIVSLSPIKAAPRAAVPAVSSPVPGTNGIELVDGMQNVVSDIEQVFPGQFGYGMGDIYEGGQGSYGY